jgi:hypothetical protein
MGLRELHADDPFLPSVGDAVMPLVARLFFFWKILAIVEMRPIEGNCQR